MAGMLTNLSSPKFIQNALRWANSSLEQSKFFLSEEDIRKKSRIILSSLLQKDPSFCIAYPDHILTQEEWEKFQTAITLLSQGHPLSRILGTREFWGLPFSLNEDTLDPRPDSETLIEAVLTWVKAHNMEKAPLRILDLGTGSGCLLLALLSELPNALGIGVDISQNALAQAQENADALGLSQRVSFINTSWTQGLNGLFDIIISNPPYIPTEEIASLEANVREFDPLRALDGGKEGLDCYKLILGDLSRLLAPTHRCFFEMGSTQEKSLSELCQSYGYNALHTHYDLENRPRVLSFSFKV